VCSFAVWPAVSNCRKRPMVKQLHNDAGRWPIGTLISREFKKTANGDLCSVCTRSKIFVRIPAGYWPA